MVTQVNLHLSKNFYYQTAIDNALPFHFLSQSHSPLFYFAEYLPEISSPMPSPTIKPIHIDLLQLTERNPVGHQKSKKEQMTQSSSSSSASKQFIGHNRSKNFKIDKKVLWKTNSNGAAARKERQTVTHADVSRHPETDEVEASAQRCTSAGGSFLLLLPLLLLLLLFFFFFFFFFASRRKRSAATRVGGAYPSRRLLSLLLKQGWRGSSVSLEDVLSWLILVVETWERI